MDESKTVNAMTNMIGRGKISIEGAADLARCIVDDHSIPHEALVAFSSLGASGNCPGNSERDLHRWLQRLWNFNLQPYTVYMDLEVTKRSDSIMCLCGVESFCKLDPSWDSFDHPASLRLEQNGQLEHLSGCCSHTRSCTVCGLQGAPSSLTPLCWGI